MCNIRLLKATEIDVRVQSLTRSKDKAVLLLYKDARCDMAILDETFGMYGWQREHTFKNNQNYCAVKIWDKEKSSWVVKEDIGTESNTEKEKGQASDAFKRACFNVGIGRELYTAPTIFVSLNQNEVGEKGLLPWVKFYVSHIEYDESRSISDLTITDKDGHVRYSMNNPSSVWKSTQTPAASAQQHQQPQSAQPQATQKRRFTDASIDNAQFCEQYCNWLYGQYLKSPEKFDAVKITEQYYDVDEFVKPRIAAVFANYVAERKEVAQQQYQ